MKLQKLKINNIWQHSDVEKIYIENSKFNKVCLCYFTDETEKTPNAYGFHYEEKNRGVRIAANTSVNPKAVNKYLRHLLEYS